MILIIINYIQIMTIISKEKDQIDAKVRRAKKVNDKLDSEILNLEKKLLKSSIEQTLVSQIMYMLSFTVLIS